MANIVLIITVIIAIGIPLRLTLHRTTASANSSTIAVPLIFVKLDNQIRSQNKIRIPIMMAHNLSSMPKELKYVPVIISAIDTAAPNPINQFESNEVFMSIPYYINNTNSHTIYMFI